MTPASRQYDAQNRMYPATGAFMPQSVSATRITARGYQFPRYRIVILHLGVYNFVRKHHSLGTTPAVAAGFEEKARGVINLRQSRRHEDVSRSKRQFSVYAFTVWLAGG